MDIAGPDQEVGWMELKRILDHSMRDGKLRDADYHLVSSIIPSLITQSLPLSNLPNYLLNPNHLSYESK